MASLSFMTISASLMILAGLVLRAAFLYRAPRRVFMTLWGLVVLRLLIPIDLPFAASFFTLFRRSAPKPLSVQTGLLLQEAMPSLAPAVGDSAPAGLPILLIVYALGGLLVALAIALNHVYTLRRCRHKTLRFVMNGRVRVYTSAMVDTPLTYGLFAPKILLPKALSDADCEAVLRHELSHIRGLDLLKKYALAAALCIHWFNPLVWLMVRLALSDMELLCDARATEHLSPAARSTYAHALLNAEERRTSLALAFKSDTEVRIMNILHPKKAGIPMTLFAVLCTVVLAAACATSPAPEPESVPVTPESTVSIAPSKADELNEAFENLSLTKRKIPDASANTFILPLKTYETNLEHRNLKDDEYRFFVERLMEIAGEQLDLAENERVLVSTSPNDKILIHVYDYKKENAEREEQMNRLIAAVSDEERQRLEAERDELLAQYEQQEEQLQILAAERAIQLEQYAIESAAMEYVSSVEGLETVSAGLKARFNADADAENTRSIAVYSAHTEEPLLTLTVAEENYDACLEALRAQFIGQNLVIKLGY